MALVAAILFGAVHGYIRAFEYSSALSAFCPKRATPMLSRDQNIGAINFNGIMQGIIWRSTSMAICSSFAPR